MTHPRPEAPERIWIEPGDQFPDHLQYPVDGFIEYVREDALRPAASEVESCESCGKEYPLDSLSISGGVRVCNNCLPCSYCEGKGKQFEALSMARETCLYCSGSGRRLAASEGEGVAIGDIVAERNRQIHVEGWMPEHDDEHAKGEMAQAAVCYAMGRTRFGDAYGPEDLWPLPWDRSWWKPGTYRRNLVKAAALIVAEIERIDRAALSAAPKPPQSPSHDADVRIWNAAIEEAASWALMQKITVNGIAPDTNDPIIKFGVECATSVGETIATAILALRKTSSETPQSPSLALAEEENK